MKGYFLKVAKHAVDNGKTFTGNSVWRKIGGQIRISIIT